MLISFKRKVWRDRHITTCWFLYPL